MPHAITYLGDPRCLPWVAPEMDAAADEYFKKFRDAGLETGICIRPTTIVAADPQKYPWIKTRYGHMDNVDALENICDKIAYARRRWACTIFYMDTPGLYLRRGGKTSYFQIPTRILRQAHQRYPDILLFPEFADNGGFATRVALRRVRRPLPHARRRTPGVPPHFYLLGDQGRPAVPALGRDRDRRRQRRHPAVPRLVRRSPQRALQSGLERGRISQRSP